MTTALFGFDLMPHVPRLSFNAVLLLLLSILGLSVLPANADARVLRIHIDADYSNNLASARSIELGVRTALSRTELHPDGVSFEIVTHDHRGNSKRSLKNLLKFLNDPSGLAVVGGIHSPPYLTYRDRINDNGILLLLPWSAAGPITRTERRTNWIFRVSVDDTKAGAFLVESAVARGGCVRPALVLLNTGWGRANETAIRAAMKARGLDQPAAFFMDLSISDALACVTARDVIGSGADCVIYVGETRGGAPLMTELAKAKHPVRVFSHWGITGADFVQETTQETRSRVDLYFLQTCMPFGQAEKPAVQTATATARSIAPDQFTRLEDLDAPVGFVHGYDLGLILMAALRTQPTDGSIADLRVRVRDALERLPAPVEGLMKTYIRPFSDQGFDSHEALGAGDLCLARFDADGRVVLPRTGAAGSL